LATTASTPLFEPDQFTLINETYFAAIPRGDNAFEPSGWIETWPHAGSLIRHRKKKLSLRRYYMDEGSALGVLRGDLHRLLTKKRSEVGDAKSTLNAMFACSVRDLPPARPTLKLLPCTSARLFLRSVSTIAVKSGGNQRKALQSALGVRPCIHAASAGFVKLRKTTRNARFKLQISCSTN
jgi:hypothetical protein